MTTGLLPCVEIEPRGAARAAVVWLHGLGADGHDFEPVVPLLGVEDLGVRFVFPHAPSIPVTINAGMVMPAWYDVVELDLERRPDTAGVERSAASVRALLGRERERGIPASRTVLAGFSQGGVVALHLGLRLEERLAGILALSSYLATEEGLARGSGAAIGATPIFQAHGTLDPMVPCARGAAARDRLVELGHAVEWHEYPIGHEVCREELDAIGAWLRRVLG